jgi:hypothetical protein
MRNTHPRETGIALVTVLVMIVLMATLVSITSILAIGNRKAGADTVLGTKAQYAAEAGLENAMYQVYYKTKENWQVSTGANGDNNDNTKFDACMFRKWLTGVWRIGSDTTFTDTQLTANGNKDCPYASAPAVVSRTESSGATFPTLFDGVTIDNSPLLNKFIEGNTTNGVRYDVSINRKEDATSGETILTMTSTGVIIQGGKETAFRKLAQVAKISSRAYDGDRFAMLTNATNCSFCHLQIDTMQRAYADPSAPQTYNRARVAVLESGLSLSDGWHALDTFVAGTLYARGAINGGDHVYGAAWAKNAAGTVIPGQIAAGSVESIRGNYLSNTDTSDVAKAANVVNAADATGAKTKFAKIYSNYPTEKKLNEVGSVYGGQWPDGPVPDNFPTVITEIPASTDGLVSDAEWTSYLANAPSGRVVAEANTRIFGVRRPTSSSTNAVLAATPVSYDPTSSESGTGLYATTIQGSANGATFQAQLTQFITDVRANNAAGISTFTTNWKGWLLQQALASPNNRDLQPGVASISDGSTAPISAVLVNGSAQNNFWVNYNPQTQIMTLTFRDYTTGTPAVAAVAAVAAVTAVAPVAAVPPSVSAPVITTPTVDCGSGCTAPSSGTLGNVQTTVSNIQATLIIRKSRSSDLSSSPKPITAGSAINCTNIASYTFSASTTGYSVRSCSYSYTKSVVTTTPGTPAVVGVTGVAAVPGSPAVAAVPGVRITPDRTIQISITEADIFPQQGNAAATDLAANGKWDGNVIIDAGRIGDVGLNRAITINGTIHINGDVVIRGQIKGRGRIVARGNIYVVGDLVYGCGDHACRITDSDTTLPSYRKWQNLPLLGLLAGGNVIVGDYDFPDYRATNSTAVGGGVYDLVNDQVGRHVSDAGASSGIPGSQDTNGFSSYSIPGATGTNTWGCCGMGFVPMIAANANWKNLTTAGDVASGYKTTSKQRYFQSMPFGPIVGRGGFGSYEDGGGFVDAVGDATVITMFPSNGPVSIGNSSNNGFSGTTQISGLACSASTPGVQANRFGAGTVNFNYGFYCPPSSLTSRYLRNSTVSASGDPSTNTSVWTPQSPQNAGLDANAGMTTGWLAGLVARPNGGSFTQIGDLSQSRLIKLMWLTTMEVNRDVDSSTAGKQAGPLRTDGIFYSPHGIFSLARSYKDKWVQTDDPTTAMNDRSNTGGRWIHNGSVVAAELGFLITSDYKRVSSDTSAAAPFTDENLGGDHVHQKYANRNSTLVNFLENPTEKNVGAAMQIFYDERLAGFLNLTSGVPVQIQRTGGYRQVSR